MQNQDLKSAAPPHRGAPASGRNNARTSVWRMLDPSFLLAGLGTVVFYGIVLQPSMHGTLLHQYTTEHIVEYAIVALFIWGLVDILFKYAHFPREFLALRQDFLPPSQGREPVSNAAQLLQQIRSLPRWQQESRLGRGLREMLEVVAEKGSARDCREDHQRLIEREDDKFHTEYTLVRFVTGVTPILGFLGTVVHFGTALSGMSFDEMTEKLPVVVAEMGMAFNTTTVALAAAMVTMFLMFLCERTERGLMRTVDRHVEREVVNRFEVREQQFEPFLDVLQSVHESALQAFANSVQRQFEKWGGNFETLLQRFDAHQQQSALAWQNALAMLQQTHEAYATSSELRLDNTLNMIDAAENKHLLAVQKILHEAATFRQELAGFAHAFDSLSRGEGRLVEIQGVLSDNLRVLQQSGQIDEALHGLTAAIHLLTVRHRPLELDAAA